MNSNEPRVKEQLGNLAPTFAQISDPQLIASFLRSLLTSAGIAAPWTLVPCFKRGARNY